MPVIEEEEESAALKPSYDINDESSPRGIWLIEYECLGSLLGKLGRSVWRFSCHVGEADRQDK